MKKQKFANWFKKYGTYATAGALVLLLSGAVLVTGLNASSQKAELNDASNPVVSVGTYPITFSMPMANASLIKDFSVDELYLNGTLGRWEYHDGIDLTSSDLKVYAVADGEVVDVSENSLYGTVITLKHANGLQSLYASLSDDVLVEKGDKVKAGTELGKADDTASSEAADGKHLHFSLIENGKKIGIYNIEFEQMHGTGTPEDLDIYLEILKNKKKITNEK